MKKYLLYCIALTGAFLASASSAEAQTATPAAPGTYQFRGFDIKMPVDVFTDDILLVIEANRDSLVDKTLTVGPNTEVTIFSYSRINAPGFIPVTPNPLFDKYSPDLFPVEPDAIPTVT